MNHRSLLITLAAVLVWTAPAQAGPQLDAPVSIHQLELELHRNEPSPQSPPASRVPRARRTRAEGDLSRVVYGYYPFWIDDLSEMRWSALTHMAWFSIEMDSAGQVTATHGWPDQSAVDAAHTAGVRVDLTFTLFSPSGITTLCGDPARRATAVTNMVDQMEAGGADGVSVDFEGLQGAVRETFVSLIAELRAELDVRGHSDAEISIAGPAVDWSDAVDLDSLLDYADYYFVMGYGYFWSGSGHAGPVGMLRVTDDWAAFQSLSTLRSIAHYSSIVPAAKRRQIIWGVPYYGREWVTADDQMGSATLSSQGAVTYSQSVSDLAGGLTRLWHDGVKNPWYRWQSGGSWHQVYYDDAESLAAKYLLALEQDLGGIGIWALGYDRPHQELWDLLETTFSAEPEHSPGHRDDPLPIDSFPFHDERDTSEGASHYFNYYSCDVSQPEFGREWVYAFDVCQPGSLLASVPDYPDRDPDLHLLDAPDQDACLARAHTDLEAQLTPGRYYLVVDTWVDMPVEQEGPYELDVDFIPSDGSSPCASYLTCEAGSCVCPDAAEVECDGGCVDTTSDVAHCGACGQPCAEGESCMASTCTGVGGDGGGAGEGGQAPAFGISGDEDGCGCALPGKPQRALPAWIAALLAGSMLRRRRAQRGAR